MYVILALLQMMYMYVYRAVIMLEVNPGFVNPGLFMFGTQWMIQSIILAEPTLSSSDKLDPFIKYMFNSIDSSPFSWLTSFQHLLFLNPHSRDSWEWESPRFKPNKWHPLTTQPWTNRWQLLFFFLLLLHTRSFGSLHEVHLSPASNRFLLGQKKHRPQSSVTCIIAFGTEHQ